VLLPRNRLSQARFGIAGRVVVGPQRCCGLTTGRNYKPSHKYMIRCIPEEDAAMELTDEQWAALEPVLGTMLRRADGRGRTWRDSRQVLNGAWWVLRTGAQGHTLPAEYPPYQTCHRRFQRWVRDGTVERGLEALARDLKECGRLDPSECFVDGTFVVAKKGADVWVRPSGGKARSAWQWRQWQTTLVFRSPLVPPRLRLTR
jgi:transposase